MTLRKRMLAVASLSSILATAGLLGTPSTASAGSFTTDTLHFVTPTQSIWGPGSSAAAFSSSGFLLGNSATGISYSSSASTGTVRSSVTGRLGAGFEDTVPFSFSDAVIISLAFQGAGVD